MVVNGFFVLFRITKMLGPHCCLDGDKEANGSENAGIGNRVWIDREGMFDELRARASERNRQRELLMHESNQTRRMLREFMDRVVERNRRLANSVDQTGATPPPPVTIIRKKNTLKFLVEPGSPSSNPGLGSSLLPAGEDTVASSSPVGDPLCSSTPSATPQPVDPLVNGNGMEKGDQLSNSGSDSTGAYIDIDLEDDIQSLVNAGIVPVVSQSLKDELSLCWQNLERTRSGISIFLCHCGAFLFILVNALFPAFRIHCHCRSKVCKNYVHL